jgi:hypothetical protein
MNIERVWVHGGLFIDTVDLGTSSYAAPYPQPFQLFTEDGKLATGEYRGRGVVIERDGARWLLIGDPYSTTRLEQYRIAAEPLLDEHDRRTREDYRAGFAAGADGARKRPRPGATYDWREGWKDGRHAIGRTP